MELRDYQSAEVEAALTWLKSNPTNSKRLAVAPTGSGKGVIQLVLLRLLNAAGMPTALITPSNEIIKGLLSRSEVDQDRIYTPAKLFNGRDYRRYSAFIIDECHEWLPSNQWPQRLERAGGFWFGYTATPYRANAAGTAELLEYWGKATEILSIQEAVHRGYCARPELDILPLVDDDSISVLNGEFQPRSTTEHYLQRERLDTLAKLVNSLSETRHVVVSVSSAIMGRALESKTSGLYVGQYTSSDVRDRIYRCSRTERLPIFQLGVLYRGTDLPWLDVLIDAQPTMSATRWVQTVGRITRPWLGRTKRVICTNRNLERHATYLAGYFPDGIPRNLLEAFPLSDRIYSDMSRWLGFEKARKCWRVRLAGENYYWFRFTASTGNGDLRHYGALVQPVKKATVWGSRLVKATKHGWKYAPWKKCEQPTDLTGMRSGVDRPPTTKQLDFWEKCRNATKAEGLPEFGEEVTAMGFILDLRRR